MPDPTLPNPAPFIEGLRPLYESLARGAAGYGTHAAFQLNKGFERARGMRPPGPLVQPQVPAPGQPDPVGQALVMAGVNPLALASRAVMPTATEYARRLQHALLGQQDPQLVNPTAHAYVRGGRNPAPDLSQANY